MTTIPKFWNWHGKWCHKRHMLPLSAYWLSCMTRLQVSIRPLWSVCLHDKKKQISLKKCQTFSECRGTLCSDDHVMKTHQWNDWIRVRKRRYRMLNNLFMKQFTTMFILEESTDCIDYGRWMGVELRQKKSCILLLHTHSMLHVCK